MSGNGLSAILASLLVAWTVAATTLYVQPESEGPNDKAGNQKDQISHEAMGRLLKVFGLDHPGHRERHYTPPQYMLDLYNAIADSSGITHTVNPYYANIVRSFPDKETSHPLRFFFNMTPNIPSKEKILEAEFHLYKLKPRPRIADRYPDPRTHLLEVRIYQIMSPEKSTSEEGNRLLDIRRISAHSVGWEVFYVKPAVLDWFKDDKLNFGLLVSVKNMMGLPVEDGVLRFAKRHQHHVNKQPILVVFSDDGRPKQSTTINKIDFRDYGYPDLSFYGHQQADSKTEVAPSASAPIPIGIVVEAPNPAVITIGETVAETLEPPPAEVVDLTRVRRSDHPGKLTKDIPNKNLSQGAGCTRHELYVDFEKIGWSSWIVSPKGYNAFYCKGECAFPLGQNQWPTNHATVQSIVHELKLTPDVGTPCCVPNKLYSISLLYFDEDGNVILKQYDDMVASSCGCH